MSFVGLAYDRGSSWKLGTNLGKSLAKSLRPLRSLRPVCVNVKPPALIDCPTLFFQLPLSSNLSSPPAPAYSASYLPTVLAQLIIPLHRLLQWLFKTPTRRLASPSSPLKSTFQVLRLRTPSLSSQYASRSSHV